MSNLDTLLAQQELAIESLDRVVLNFKKLGKAKWTGAVVRQRIANLKAAFTECKELNLHIRMISTDAHKSTLKYFTEDHFQRCEDIFNEASDFLANVQEAVEPPALPLNISLAPETQRKAVSHLPRLDLPSFDGSLQIWESFRDRFRSLIHGDNALSNVERMHYLLSCVKGEAHRALSNLTITAANYTVAWQILVSRYENKRRLVTEHLETLLNLPSMTAENPSELRNLCDTAHSSIQALKNLGRQVEAWDDILVILVAKNLSRNTRQAWEFKLGDSAEYPSYTELDHFLHSRLRALEALPSAQGSQGNRHESRDSKYSRNKAVVSLAATPTKSVQSQHNRIVDSARKMHNCTVCRRDHPLYACPEFITYAVHRCLELVKTNKLCFNCLSSSHSRHECSSIRRCKICSEQHHTLLHTDSHDLSTSKLPGESSKAQMPETNSIAAHTIVPFAPINSTVLLATARVRVSSQNGRSSIVRALLDQGSAATLMSENLAQLLRVKRNSCQLRINGIGGCGSVAKHTASIRLASCHKSQSSISVVAVILASLTQYVPGRLKGRTDWTHIRGLTLADDDPFNSDRIDLIIGADLYGWLLCKGIHRGKMGQPFAQNTRFGWVLSGPVDQVEPLTEIHSYCGVLQESLGFDLQKFWEVEDLPSQSLLSAEEKECEDHFLATHRRNQDGRYIVRLPFKAGRPPDLGSSRAAASVSLRRFRNQLNNDALKSLAYQEFLSEYERLGHMDRIADSNASIGRPSYYIPHHAVYKESSTTSKLRVVFNASCVTSNGTSLNDHLLVGPKLQTDLLSIILRWRQHQFALTADIAKMYRQIHVDERDLNYQKILWQSSASSSIEEYRLLTVTYGTASAPFLALRTLRQLAQDEGASYPLARKVLQHFTYVDDCIFGAPCVNLASDTRNQLIALLSKGGFHLRKWASNSPELLTDIDEVDNGLACSKELRADESLKILGISWHPQQDEFRFCISVPTEPGSTKREILSTIARLFDPLGWVTPVVIRAKVIMQRLWQLNCGWDDKVPSAVLTEWTNFHAQLPMLRLISIPRWTRHDQVDTHLQLHGFSDASTAAYAAVVYLLVSSPTGSMSSSLLIAKSKVAPLRTILVPRLELCAAHLLARLMIFVRNTLLIEPVACHCWTDSTIVLAWLRQPPSRWKTFVANRIAFIQSQLTITSWHHVSGTDNPADCASRGLSAEDLAHHTLWWTGPSWLTGPAELWPVSKQHHDLITLPETRQLATVNAAFIEQSWDLDRRFSSWPKLIRVTAYIMRFVRRLRTRRTHNQQSSTLDNTKGSAILHLDETAAAKLYWLRTLQSWLFPQELDMLKRALPVRRSSGLASLCPFLDADGLMRAQGRLNHSDLSDSAKHPVVLKSHPVVNLIIRHMHVTALHAGSQLTLSLIRQEYWLLRSRQTVRAVLHRCVTCARAQPTMAEQFMGDLLECRVKPTRRAFTHTGVDYAGPILMRYGPGRGRQAHKAYLALFVCMTTKAIHLELVSDYSSSAFVAAYHRFVARRGAPTTLYSDCGTTFQGADRELRKAHNDAVRNPDFTNWIVSKGVSWRFIPPAAPHFGGLWEAAVRSVKYHLKRCVGKHTLTIEEMSTLLCRIEACLNSRPIAALSDNIEDYIALTPGHLLIGSPLVAPPEPSVLDLKESRLSRWQLVQRLSDTFWTTWSHDYLHALQQRPKWRVRQRLARVGRLVLISDSNAPSSHWLLGRIIECHPGDDDLVRVVKVRTAKSVLTRPITKLCFLPVDINTEDNPDSVKAGGNQTSPPLSSQHSVCFDC